MANQPSKVSEAEEEAKKAMEVQMNKWGFSESDAVYQHYLSNGQQIVHNNLSLDASGNTLRAWLNSKPAANTSALTEQVVKEIIDTYESHRYTAPSILRTVIGEGSDQLEQAIVVTLGQVGAEAALKVLQPARPIYLDNLTNPISNPKLNER